MGNLNFQFTNNPADGKPELTLIADGATAAEKILLNNILTGEYGTPRILGGISGNGMATMVKIIFEDTILPTLATQEWVEENFEPKTTDVSV